MKTNSRPHFPHIKWSLANLLCLALLLVPPTRAGAAAPPRAQNRSAWFRQAKFGMFVHWGLYSQAAGMWHGRRYFGIGEWLMNRARIPTHEYDTLATRFDPTNFSAKTWVDLAKAAGMKYIVITAKHHDGFAMFNSEASHFNIVDDTPYKQDPIKALAKECRRQGVRLGFYYSQWQDWHDPDAAGNTWEFTNAPEDFAKYFRRKCIPQVKELLTHYGPVAILWFDTPGGMTSSQSQQLVNLVHVQQPRCLVNSRVGNDAGDFTDLGDDELPSVLPAGPWESLFSLNDTWGYVRADQNWLSTCEVIHMLAKINARGGNLLLNVGPKGDGDIPTEAVRILRRVGHWVHQNAEAVYGTRASPFPPLAWGVCTAKPGVFYFHVFQWPEDHVLRIPGVAGDVSRVTLLSSGKKLSWRHEGSDVLVSLPDCAPDTRDTVIKVNHEHVVIAPTQALLPQYANILAPVRAKLTGPTKLNEHSWMLGFGDWKHEQRIEGWNRPDDTAEWPIRVVEPGEYRVRLVLEQV